MATIREIRESQTRQTPHGSDAVKTVTGAVVAFAVGALAIFSWQHLSTPQFWNDLFANNSSAPASAKFTGARLGRAETAPLLRQCVPYELLQMEQGEVEPGIILKILRTGSMVARVAAVAGQKKDRGPELAVAWGGLADCVYRQNSWNLCDVDNRALAVESISAFTKFAAGMSTTDAQANAMVDNTRDRLFASLRARLSSGYLIADDFGLFASSDLKRLIGEVPTTENACEKK